MGDVIDIRTRQSPDLTPAERARLERRIVDTDVEIALLQSERERLARRLGKSALSPEDPAS